MISLNPNYSILKSVRVHPGLKIVLYDMGFKILQFPPVLYTIGPFINIKKLFSTKHSKSKHTMQSLTQSGYEFIKSSETKHHTEDERRFGKYCGHNSKLNIKRRF